MRMLSTRQFSRGIVAAALGLALPQFASAALTLTAAGTADGFTLTTFASNFPSSGGIGPVGAATFSNGNVVVFNYADNSNYVFADTDGQTPATALFKTFYGNGATGAGLVRLGSTVYGIHNADSTIRVVNPDGSAGATVSNVANYNGLGANAAQNVLYAAGPNGIHRIDLNNPNPNTNATPFAWSGFADGITVSPDNSTMWIESGNQLRGFDTTTGVQTSVSPFISGADGVGVITGGALDGDLVVNTNFGMLYLWDPVSNALTPIADGGSRGDLVGFDDSNGTLFVTQGDSVMRLALKGATIGGGGGDGGGGGGGTVPEPGTLALLCLGFAGMAVSRKHRQ